MIAPREEQAIALARKLAPEAPGWIRFVGFLGAGDLPALEARILEWDAAMLAPGMGSRRELIERCARMGKLAMVVPGIEEMMARRARPVEIGDALLFLLRAPGLTAGQRAMKRAFDVAAAAALALALSPVMLIAYLLVRATSRGPAIFSQDRVGEGGRQYTLYKFRTMVADAEKSTGPVLARDSDPRITPLGAAFRATRIDELPQLLNVLRGEMSLIGPRPERDFFVRTFRQTIPGYDLRFRVKPGITGLAQVAGGYSTPADRKLRFDLLYIHDYSWSLDLWILLRTILVVLHKERAAGLKAAAPVAADER